MHTHYIILVCMCLNPVKSETQEPGGTSHTSPRMPHKSHSQTWTVKNSHFSPQNHHLTKKSKNTRVMKLWIYHKGFSFTLTTTSHCPPSLLNSLESSTNTGSTVGICVLEKPFLKSMLWLFKPIIHWKINMNLTVYHWTTVEYFLRIQETFSSGNPLLHNNVLWIYW